LGGQCELNERIAADRFRPRLLKAVENAFGAVADLRVLQLMLERRNRQRDQDAEQCKGDHEFDQREATAVFRQG